MEIQEANFFSVIADEVTDVSNKEQCSICVRYVLAFLSFMEIERITGQVLADTVLQYLESCGLSPSNPRGQCYDGGSNMAGSRSGCKAIVQAQSPKAVYVHCAALRLNLAVVSACKIQAFRNADSDMGEIARFFRFSAKRQRFLEKAVDIASPGSSGKKLKDACRTRWIQRIDAHAVFLDLLPTAHMVLQATTSPTQFDKLCIDWNWDAETVSKANGFLSIGILLIFTLLENPTRNYVVPQKTDCQATNVECRCGVCIQRNWYCSFDPEQYEQ